MVRIQYVEDRIRAIIEGFGDTYFFKREVVRTVCLEPQVANILGRLTTMPRRWPVDQIFVDYIEGRVAHFLRDETMVVAQTVNGPLRVRTFENYAAEDGRRWQRIMGLTANDLRVCMQARRRQVAGHERVIRVYEAMLAILERIGPTATMTNMAQADLATVAAVANEN